MLGQNKQNNKLGMHKKTLSQQSLQQQENKAIGSNSRGKLTHSFQNVTNKNHSPSGGYQQFQFNWGMLGQTPSEPANNQGHQQQSQEQLQQSNKISPQHQNGQQSNIFKGKNSTSNKDLQSNRNNEPSQMQNFGVTQGSKQVSTANKNNKQSKLGLQNGKKTTALQMKSKGTANNQNRLAKRKQQMEQQAPLNNPQSKQNQQQQNHMGYSTYTQAFKQANGSKQAQFQPHSPYLNLSSTNGQNLGDNRPSNSFSKSIPIGTMGEMSNASKRYDSSELVPKVNFGQANENSSGFNGGSNQNMQSFTNSRNQNNNQMFFDSLLSENLDEMPENEDLRCCVAHTIPDNTINQESEHSELCFNVLNMDCGTGTKLQTDKQSNSRQVADILFCCSDGGVERTTFQADKSKPITQRKQFKVNTMEQIIRRHWQKKEMSGSFNIKGTSIPTSTFRNELERQSGDCLDHFTFSAKKNYNSNYHSQSNSMNNSYLNHPSASFNPNNLTQNPTSNSNSKQNNSNKANITTSKINNNSKILNNINKRDRQSISQLKDQSYFTQSHNKSQIFTHPLSNKLGDFMVEDTEALTDLYLNMKKQSNMINGGSNRNYSKLNGNLVQSNSGGAIQDIYIRNASQNSINEPTSNIFQERVRTSLMSEGGMVPDEIYVPQRSYLATINPVNKLKIDDVEHDKKSDDPLNNLPQLQLTPDKSNEGEVDEYRDDKSNRKSDQYSDNRSDEVNHQIYDDQNCYYDQIEDNSNQQVQLALSQINEAPDETQYSPNSSILIHQRKLKNQGMNQNQNGNRFSQIQLSSGMNNSSLTKAQNMSIQSPKSPIQSTESFKKQLSARSIKNILKQSNEETNNLFQQMDLIPQQVKDQMKQNSKKVKLLPGTREVLDQNQDKKSCFDEDDSNSKNSKLLSNRTDKIEKINPFSDKSELTPLMELTPNIDDQDQQLLTLSPNAGENKLNDLTSNQNSNNKKMWQSMNKPLSNNKQMSIPLLLPTDEDLKSVNHLNSIHEIDTHVNNSITNIGQKQNQQQFKQNLEVLRSNDQLHKLKLLEKQLREDQQIFQTNNKDQPSNQNYVQINSNNCSLIISNNITQNNFIPMLSPQSSQNNFKVLQADDIEVEQFDKIECIVDDSNAGIQTVGEVNQNIQDNAQKSMNQEDQDQNSDISSIKAVQVNAVETIGQVEDQNANLIQLKSLTSQDIKKELELINQDSITPKVILNPPPQFGLKEDQKAKSQNNFKESEESEQQFDEWNDQDAQFMSNLLNEEDLAQLDITAGVPNDVSLNNLLEQLGHIPSLQQKLKSESMIKSKDISQLNNKSIFKNKKLNPKIQRLLNLEMMQNQIKNSKDVSLLQKSNSQIAVQKLLRAASNNNGAEDKSQTVWNYKDDMNSKERTQYSASPINIPNDKGGQLEQEDLGKLLDYKQNRHSRQIKLDSVNSGYQSQRGQNKQFRQELETIKKLCLDNTSIKPLAHNIYGFGTNKHFELGIMNKNVKQTIAMQANGVDAFSYQNVYLPRIIRFEQSANYETKDLKVRQIIPSDNHCAIVTECNKLFIAGSYLMDKLGFPPPQGINYACQKKFKQLLIPKNKYQYHEVVQYACGDMFSLCLTTAGQVYVWGGTLKGKRGDDPDKRYAATMVARSMQSALDEIKDFELKQQVYNQITQSDQHTQVNSSSLRNYIPLPIQPLQAVQVKQIACGKMHSVAVTFNGLVYAWGDQQFEQCGHDYKNTILPKLTGDESQDYKYLKPRVVQFFKNQSLFVERVECGANHTVAIVDSNKSGSSFNIKEADTTSGEEWGEQTQQQQYSQRVRQSRDQQGQSLGDTVFVFGSNSQGQCGIQNKDTITAPQQLVLPQQYWGMGVEQVAAGEAHTLLLLKSSGGEQVMLSFGSNDQGQLGRATSSINQASLPSNRLPGLVEIQRETEQNMIILKGIEAHQESDSDDMPITKMIEVNISNADKSKVHINDTSNINSRQYLAEQQQFIKQISCGKYHSLVLFSNGQVYGCGKTSQGELGIGGGKDTQFELEDLDYVTPKMYEKGVREFIPLYSVNQVQIESIYSGGSHSFVVVNRDKQTLRLKKSFQ